MSKLQELIRELCPDGVEFRKLGEVCKIFSGKNKQKKEQGKYPVYGSTGIIAYCDNYQYDKKQILIARVGANAGFIHIANGRYDVSDNTLIVDVMEMYNSTYIYYVLANLNINRYSKGGGQPLVTASDIKMIEIPLPPLEVQNEIVRILDTFTAHAAELQAELQARKEQYEYYRNKLLTFDENDERVKWVKLGEIGTFVRGNGLQKKDFTDEGFPCIHYGQIHTYYGTFATSTISYTSDLLAKRLRKASYGDLIIATTSEDIDGVCKACAWLGENEVAISGDAYIYKHSQNPKYMSYLFQTKLFYDYKKKSVTGTKVIRVSGESMEKFKLPIPPLSEQQRIVSILDKFESLVNDLSEGLPAEIAAVQEQYEYYRNKLLTFKRKS
ncbi:type I restriction modification DNA specificity domain protein [Bacteroides sp. CAG:1076]|nr:type I restriction modification DNA specificity domain protein [Bacteroides sp. CAG:1076]